jgi:N-glycosylase/DNA lyase
MHVLNFPSKAVPFSLDLCLESGQAFGWQKHGEFWRGSIRQNGFVLRQTASGLQFISTTSQQQGGQILSRHFTLDEDHNLILERFPKDPFLRNSIQFCAGLRILRQDPWECLAGFILSSTKKIIHIQQIWQKLCTRWGNPVRLEDADTTIHCFPEASRIAAQSETNLRACGMGFRAPYLKAAAENVVSGRLDASDGNGTRTLDGIERRGTKNCRLCSSLLPLQIRSFPNRYLDSQSS